MLVSPRSSERARGTFAGRDPEQILRQVDRISASSAFARAERVRRFLRFVVEQRLAGCADNLKEFAIGTAVFDWDESYDPRLDPIVRVEASRLRNKLREYYENEGRTDTIHIGLEKGSYGPVITFRSSPTGPIEMPAPLPLPRKAAGVLPRQVAFALFAGVLVWAVSAQTALWKERAATRQQQEALTPFLPVWGRFFSGSQNTVVFGSTAMQNRLGDYIETGDAMALERLTAFLSRAGAPVKAIPSHQAIRDGIKDGNIVFIGSDPTHPLISPLPGTLPFVFDDDSNVINNAPAPGEPHRWQSVHDEKIYALVSRLRGLSPERDILVLTSPGSTGIMAAADYLTRADTIAPLLRRLNLQSEGEPFQVLLRVYVDKGNPVKTEYVAHHLLPATP